MENTPCPASDIARKSSSLTSELRLAVEVMARHLTKAGRERTVPEWAKVVGDLRKRLNLTQTKLGEMLQCSAMSVSRWERGLLEPSAGQYLELGNLSPDPVCWYLWGRAGLRTSDVMRVLRACRRRQRENRLDLAIADAGSGHKKHADRQLVTIPLLKVVAGAHGYRG